MPNQMQTAGYKANLSATANISPRPCDLLGIFVSAASATPTITVYDSATTTTADPIVTVFTPAASTFYPMPAATKAGLYVVIGGTVNCTIFFA